MAIRLTGNEDENRRLRAKFEYVDASSILKLEDSLCSGTLLYSDSSGSASLALGSSGNFLLLIPR